jgi:peroxiredoxin
LKRAIIVLISLISFSAVVSAQSIKTDEKEKSFFLDGNLKGKDTGVIILIYSKDNKQRVRDTSYVTNGKFSFVGKVLQPSFCTLKITTGKGNYTNFFLEEGQQQILVQDTKFEDFIMSGSYTQRQDDTLKQQIKLIELKYKDVNDKYVKLVNDYKKATDSLSKSKVYQEGSQILGWIRIENEERNKETMLFISKHYDSYVSPVYLYGFLTNHAIETDSTEILYNSFTDRVKDSEFGKLIKEELIKRRVNIKAPDFATNDIQDSKIVLSSFHGKYILLNFWASYCIPCIEEFPDLKETLTMYRSSGLEIINISVDISKSSWADAIKKFGLQNFHNIFAKDNDTLQNKYSNITQPIPSQILINRKGIIIWNSLNQQTEQNIKTILQKEFDKKE